ncbi:MAG: hypothetical protein IPH82_04325 [Chloroflexi bacterium]|nr:hypothetical protein [Chloroflexota bacterium]
MSQPLTLQHKTKRASIWTAYHLYHFGGPNGFSKNQSQPAAKIIDRSSVKELAVRAMILVGGSNSFRTGLLHTHPSPASVSPSTSGAAEYGLGRHRFLVRLRFAHLKAERL